MQSFGKFININALLSEESDRFIDIDEEITKL